ncbi:hypothetical protein FRC09_016081, partial [Ceratobasidium sp. 395]
MRARKESDDRSSMFLEHVTSLVNVRIPAPKFPHNLRHLTAYTALHPVLGNGGAPQLTVRRSPAPPSTAYIRAVTTPNSGVQVNAWEPGTQYNIGDEVEYQGVRYKIVQPHRSQGDWTPDVVPALWGREYGSAPTNQAQQTYNAPEQRPWDQHDQTKVEFGQEEKEKNWYDLDPERRQQLEIGGGLLAGAALLGGGFLAYKKHKEHEEDKKAQAWGLQNWMTGAQDRTRQYHQGGSQGVTWVLTHGTQIPQ